ncbi:hypothetical protein BC827DRAFT_1159247 [Russula dissimulans]|nr:hypothetical protein BC827DRAFT_1159247 [Russula dissimulans]
MYQRTRAFGPGVADTVLHCTSIAHVELLSSSSDSHFNPSWEFVSNLNYEWGVIRGHRPHRWTMWIYFITRLATLAAVIMNLVSLKITASASSSGCQMFAYTTFSLASLLIVLRIIAIWNKNKLIVGLATGVWVTNTSILIHGLTRIRSSWNSELVSCSLPDIMSNISAIISMFASDVVLLLVMFIGLFRLRHCGGGTFGLVRLLWKQGILYLLVATAAELPPLVFICLDLNGQRMLTLLQMSEALDLMFLMPSLIAMSISATRMYRSLMEGFCDDTGKGLNSFLGKRVSCTEPNAEWTTTTLDLPNRVEVSMDSSYDPWQSPATQTDPYVSFINIENQMGDKPRGMSSDDYVESSTDK